MPIIWPACAMRLVRRMSSSEGEGSPEGWLCMRTTPAAACPMAGAKISLGYVLYGIMWPSQNSMSNQPSMSCFRGTVLLHITGRQNHG
jgi:hypothetical protein